MQAHELDGAHTTLSVEREPYVTAGRGSINGSADLRAYIQPRIHDRWVAFRLGGSRHESSFKRSVLILVSGHQSMPLVWQSRSVVAF